MRIQAKYLIAFLSGTVITVIIVGVSLWGFNSLRKTTDYLVTVNSRVLEFASYFDKELAHSRRAEKEFFIFPNNKPKQAKYITKWKGAYNKIRGYLDELERLFLGENNAEMFALVAQARKVMDENETLFASVVVKFKLTGSYDTVNKAEYGTFKEKTHILEDIAVKMSQYGLAEVEKGREFLAKTQSRTQLTIQIISILAVLWGVFVPIVLSKRMTATIRYLTQISNDISKGEMEKEITVTSRDELADLALSIKRMQTSIKIMLDRFKEGRL